MTDRAKELERRSARERVARYRARKAGLLPPLERCDCGRKALSDRWGGLCSTCAREQGVDRRGSTRERGTPRPVRLAAEAMLRELRAQP